MFFFMPRFRICLRQPQVQILSEAIRSLSAKLFRTTVHPLERNHRQFLTKAPSALSLPLRMALGGRFKRPGDAAFSLAASSLRLCRTQPRRATSTPPLVYFPGPITAKFFKLLFLNHPRPPPLKCTLLSRFAYGEHFHTHPPIFHCIPTLEWALFLPRKPLLFSYYYPSSEPPRRWP